MILTVLIFLTFAAVPLMIWIARQGWAGLNAVLPIVQCVAFMSLFPRVSGGDVILEELRWVPSLGISLSFRADGLSLLLATLISGIGACIFLYAAKYMEDHPDRPVFFGYLTFFMGAMLGAVFAENMALMLIFWELTSLSSYLLISFEHEKQQARNSAQQGLLVTVLGGLALMAGIILIGHAAGTYQFSELLTRREQLAAHPWSAITIGLLALGAFTKSAQTPFHFWLPNAMVAPTPVSAFLHSATMVKLGIYLLARMKPIYGDEQVWITLLTIVGSVTMATGAFLSLRESDLKRILAYSTLSALGTLVVLLGNPHPIAAIAMVTFLVIHALYKASLFLVAGIVDHETGTRDSSHLRGLIKVMPVTGMAAAASGLSMAGIPLTFGFIGKELVYESILDLTGAGPLFALSILANAATLAVAFVICIRCFTGSLPATFSKAHDPSWSMLLGPLLLGAAGIVLGVNPGFADRFVGTVASCIAGSEIHSHLEVWHGVTTPLMASLVTFAAGFILFSVWFWIQPRLKSQHFMDQCGPAALYDAFLQSTLKFAAWQTHCLQSGSLNRYVAVTFLTMALAMAVPLQATSGFSLPNFGSLSLILIMPVMLAVTSIGVVRAKSFTSGVIAAGVVGFLMSLVFLFQGAPDLALTQFSVEALAIVILLAIVGRMPFSALDFRTRPQQVRDGFIAIGFGMTATLVLLSVLANPFDRSLSEYYQQASLSAAHGRNIVNVIIVDFRGLDTLGEITVLTLAAIAISALFAQRASAESPQKSRLPVVRGKP